jgi:hypothetical protein
MRITDLDRALGPTPPEFGARVAATLRNIKEEPEVRTKHIRRWLAVALAILLIIGVAIALVVTQGQDWYYHNRFTAYEGNEPEKQQAILNNLSTDIPQEQTDTGVVSVTVQDVSWAPEEGVATLSFAVRAQNPESDEIHSLFNLDEDGSWAVTLDPDDPESRTEHWLWTDKGYGPPAATMADPSKRLLLFSDGDTDVYIGSKGEDILPISVSDQFQGEDGSVICVLEFDLNQLDSQKIEEQYYAFVYDPEWGIPEDEWKADMQAQRQRSLEYAQATNAAIEANTDGNGMLALRYDYSVVPLVGNTLVTDQETRGETVFQIKVK